MCCNKYSGSNHWKWRRYKGKVVTHIKRVFYHAHLVHFVERCQVRTTKKALSSALSAWSMRVISEWLISWCLSSSKWERNNAYLTAFSLIKILWADLLLILLIYYLYWFFNDFILILLNYFLLPKNPIFRLSHPKSRDSQVQETLMRLWKVITICICIYKYMYRHNFQILNKNLGCELLHKNCSTLKIELYKPETDK